MKCKISTFKNYFKVALFPVMAIALLSIEINTTQAQTAYENSKTVKASGKLAQAKVDKTWEKPTVPLVSPIDLIIEDPITDLKAPLTINKPIEIEPDTILEAPVYDNNHKWLDRQVSFKYGKTDFVKSINYPEDAINGKVEGLVQIFFVVEPDGRTSNIKILKSLNYECDQAVIEAVHNARFNPGLRNGQPVRVHCILPVYFGLNKPQS